MTKYLFILLLPFVSMAEDSCSYPNDAVMSSNKVKCIETIGRDWDCSLNRCLTLGETIKLREDWKSCTMNHHDKTIRQSCYDDVAVNNVDLESLNKSYDVKKGSNKKIAIDSLFFAMSYLQQKGASPGGKCLSRKLFKSAAIVGVSAELYIKFQAKSKFDAIKEAYEEEQKDQAAYDAQARAIMYLKEEQELVQDLAKYRKNGYLFSAGIYLASVAVAMSETAGFLQPSCQGLASPESQTAAPAVGETVNKPNPYSKYVGGLLKKSSGIAILGAIGSSLSYKLSKHARDQEKSAKRNVASVEELLKKFEAASKTASFCAPEDREDLNKPECYCFDENGGRPTNREASETCQKLWLTQGRKVITTAQDYKTVLAGAKKKKNICMFKNFKPDYECRCRKLLDKSTKENACLKVQMGSNVRGYGSALGMRSIFKNVNSLTNGESDLGEINSVSLSKQAARNRKIVEQEIGKLNKRRKAKGLPRFDPFDASTQAKFLTKLGASDVSGHKLAALESISVNSRPQDEKINETIEKMGGSKLRFTGGTSRRKLPAKDDEMYLEPLPEHYVQGDDLGDLDNSEDEYVIDDIDKRKSKSIWKIISRRYQMTAVPILFEDD